MRTSYLLLALLGVAAFCERLTADVVETFDGKTVSGRVQSIEAGVLTVDADGDSPKPLKFSTFDLVSVKFLPPLPPHPKCVLVVDNDGNHDGGEKSGKIALKQGHHRFTLPYWNRDGGASVRLEYESPGIPRTEVPADRFFSTPQGQPTLETQASAGLDPQGLRLPDAPQNITNHIACRYSQWDTGTAVRSIDDLRNIPLARDTFATQIGLALQPPPNPQNFAVVFHGFLNVPADGEFTFYLKCKGGAQLYIGTPPPIFDIVAKPPADSDWTVTLDAQGRVTGQLKSWDESSAELEFTIADQTDKLIVLPSHLRELWTNAVVKGDLRADRTAEPTDADSVYAKTSDGQIQRVSGKAVGIRDGALQFLFGEQERTIKLERVVGIVMPKQDKAGEGRGDCTLLIHLIGRHRLPGRITAIDDSTQVVRFEPLWGGKLEIHRSRLFRASIVNGRSVSLSDIVPVRVEQVPFFNRILAYRVDQSFTGGPLRIGKRFYERGLSVHSRTVLEYDLAARFERFRCDVGLQSPDGELGRAAVRIVADGRVVFEQQDVTGSAAAESLDLDVSGKQRLTLEVDFGKGQDVGDRVVWGDGVLIRPAND